MKKLSTAAVALAAGVLLAACSNDIESTSTKNDVPDTGDWNKGGKTVIAAPDAKKAEGKRIAYLGFGQDNPWSTYMFDAVKDEAAQYGATATFVGPTTFDPQQQYQIVSDIATSKQYDVIVMVPIDSPSIVPAVEAAADAGIPTVAVGFPIGADVLSADIQAKGVISQVVEDLSLNATSMADGVKSACEGIDPCKVDVLWGARALAFDKVKPDIFYKELEGSDNIKLVCETDAAYTQDLGRTQSADCLQANPDLNVIASQADESTRGAEASVKAAGRTFGTADGDIAMVSSYASVYGIKQVRAGAWDQTAYSRPQSMGRAATRLALLGLQDVKVPTHVKMEDLDPYPYVLTPEELAKDTAVVGQWEG